MKLQNHAHINKSMYLMQRLLEKLNQNGVLYKPAAAVASGNNDADEEVDSFENGPPEKKEFVYNDDSDGEPVIDLTQPDKAVANQNNDFEEVCFHLFVFIYLNYASSFSYTKPITLFLC